MTQWLLTKPFFHANSASTGLSLLEMKQVVRGGGGGKGKV